MTLLRGLGISVGEACCSRLGAAVLAQAVEDGDVDWILSEDPEVSMWVGFWCAVADEDIEDFQGRFGALATKARVDN